MKEKIPCDLIKDILPLYDEKLCSEETNKIISEHLAECEECRKLISDIIIPETNISAVPDESSAFKKINRKIKLGKRKIRILAAFLVVIIGILIYLTAGQIKKVGKMQSFDTIFQTIEVRSLAKKLAEGNIDEYMEYISYDNLISELNNTMLAKQLREEETSHLKKLYSEYYGNKKIKKIEVSSEYIDKYYTDAKHTVIFSYVKIIFTDSDYIKLQALKGSDGLYEIFAIYYYDDCKFEQCIDFIKWHYRNSIINLKYILEKGEGNGLQSPENRTKNCFSDEYEEKVSISVKDFFEKGFKVDKYTYSKLQFDMETKMPYVDIVITASDKKGKAVMQTKLYIDYFGYLFPDSEYSVVTDGCTDELKESLMHFFG